MVCRWSLVGHLHHVRLMDIHERDGAGMAYQANQLVEQGGVMTSEPHPPVPRGIITPRLVLVVRPPAGAVATGVAQTLSQPTAFRVGHPSTSTQKNSITHTHGLSTHAYPGFLPLMQSQSWWNS